MRTVADDEPKPRMLVGHMRLWPSFKEWGEARIWCKKQEWPFPKFSLVSPGVAVHTVHTVNQCMHVLSLAVSSFGSAQQMITFTQNRGNLGKRVFFHL